MKLRLVILAVAMSGFVGFSVFGVLRAAEEYERGRLGETIASLRIDFAELQNERLDFDEVLARTVGNFEDLRGNMYADAEMVVGLGEAIEWTEANSERIKRLREMEAVLSGLELDVSGAEITTEQFRNVFLAYSEIVKELNEIGEEEAIAGIAEFSEKVGLAGEGVAKCMEAGDCKDEYLKQVYEEIKGLIGAVREKIDVTWAWTGFEMGSRALNR